MSHSLSKGEDVTKTFENSGIVIEWHHIPSAKAGALDASTVRFKAFLDVFSESYSSDWGQESVYGRMDPIESFRSTRRIIQLAWSVVSYSDEESFENMKKVSKLLKFLYPTYNIERNAYVESGFGIISASPLLRLKFMNLIQSTRSGGATQYSNAFATAPGTDSEQSYGSVHSGGLVGRVDGFDVTHELDNGLVMMEGPVAVPRRITLSCTFYPLHEHGLGWDATTKQFLSVDWPYGISEGFPSTGGGNVADPAGAAALDSDGGAVIGAGADGQDITAPNYIMSELFKGSGNT